MIFVNVPPVGARVRTLSRVFADPDGTGTFILTSGEFEVLPSGSVGRVESHFKSWDKVTICVVVFPGELRTSMSPWALEVITS